jgi:hypothetical protein
MLVLLVKLGFVLAAGIIGVLLGWISRESDTSRIAEGALLLHQTPDAQFHSARAEDSVSWRSAKAAATKRKASPEASKRAAKLPSPHRLAD